MGESGVYSGVGMHLGHFVSHFLQNSGCQVSTRQLRTLIQTGIAMILRSFADEVIQPCCQLQFIGGDGTFIGIPTRNISAETHPVWQPQTIVENSLLRWDRKCRHPLAKIFDAAELNDEHVDSFLTTLRDVTVTPKDELYRRSIAISLNDIHWLKRNGNFFFIELLRWLHLPTLSPEFLPFQIIFSCLASQDSLTGIFPLQLATALVINRVLLECPLEQCKSTIMKLSNQFAFKGMGIGPEIMEILVYQSNHFKEIKRSTLGMLLFFASASLELHEMASAVQPLQSTAIGNEDWCQRPNPATTGIRYFMTLHGKSIRTEWPLPKTAISRISQSESSCDGCTKRRPVYIGHRQRTGIWINLCMIHERVIGFHVIHNSEGRRDALIPIYRFMESPPLVMWNDFGCGCEESGLNWLPHFFHRTQHFHDMFHGFSHICSTRFSSKRMPAFSSINTSVMEQVSNATFNLLLNS